MLLDQDSSDLPQGGLEIPCTLKSTHAKDLDHLEKVKKLIKHAISFVIDTLSHHGEFLSVKEEVMDDGGREEETSDSDSSFGNMADDNCDSAHNTSNNVVDLTLGSGGTSSACPTDDSNEDWCRFGGIRLMQQNKCEILRGDKLNYLVINFVQKLLKKLFPSVKGLQSTLLQTTKAIR